MSLRSAHADGARVWTAIDSLLANARIDGIRHHGLGLLEVKRATRLGLPVDPLFRTQARAAGLVDLAAPVLVKRLREGCEGPLLLLKGPEVARLYPPQGRRYDDLDILTPRAEAVQAELLGAGFAIDEDGLVGPHHLEPLRWQQLPLSVEIHRQIKWPASPRPPAIDEILAAAIPSSLGVDGILAPCAVHHSLILAAHAWEHSPLRTLRDLLDVAVVSSEADLAEIAATAESWKMGRIWRKTLAAIDGLFYGGPQSFALRSWARHLTDCRDRTVLEAHLERWLSPYSALPLRGAVVDTVRVLRGEVSPSAGESWSDKFTRSTNAVRHWSMATWQHDASLDEPRSGESRRGERS
jgi:Uncharacterised nucleotidyltransferase